jgi:hypothetical protein
MELGPLGKRHVTEVVQKRVEHYRISPDAIAPVRREGFGLLFAILGSNLRNALKYAEQFSFWMWRHYEAIPREERAELLLTWLAEVADKHVEDTRIGGAAWHVFDQLVARGGSCSPSDHEDFGYSSPMAMRPQIKALEETNLVASVLDEADRRRKTITVTPRGWLVDYARRGYTPPQ